MTSASVQEDVIAKEHNTALLVGEALRWLGLLVALTGSGLGVWSVTDVDDTQFQIIYGGSSILFSFAMGGIVGATGLALHILVGIRSEIWESRFDSDDEE